MADYDPNAWYKFVDQNGNEHVSRGDNGYIQQSVKEGIPIYVTDKGEWFTEPFLEVTPDGFVTHMPSWFKETKEYARWNNEFLPQLNAEGSNITIDRLKQYQDTLAGLGSMGGTRQAYKKYIEGFEVTDPELQNAYVDTMFSVQTEGKKGDKAQISGIFGSDQTESAEDIARSFKNLSKEKLAEITTKLYWNMRKAQEGTSNLSQKEIADAVTTMSILNYVDDNYQEFGDGEEFKGLLEASEWQKFARMLKSFQQTWAESGIWGAGARVMYGMGEVASGRPFSLSIEDDREMSFLSPAFGGSLEGLEASDKIGNIGGFAASIATQLIISKTLGFQINGLVDSGRIAAKWSRLGTFLQTVPGAMTSDLVLNDIPIDLMFLTTDLMRHEGDLGKAIYNPEEQQNLIPIPGIGELGPKVPAGFAFNLLGDVIVDLALPVVNVMFGNIHNKLDGLTNGGWSKFEESVTIKNYELQEKLTNIPVVGTGWKKFMNFMMGEAEAEKIRNARKAAIAAGSTDPYVMMHNTMTLNNHDGTEVVFPKIKELDTKHKISESVSDFIKKKNEYGGVGTTKIDSKDLAPGKIIKGFIEKNDVLPRKVKQGVLDIERLSELKGEVAAEGGSIFNPTRTAEIEKLEAKVEKLPQEIKDFANRLSEFNKDLDGLRVELGLTTQQWHDALLEDPRWEKYMTRQALVLPGGGGPGVGTDPTGANILTKSRKGYYAENYIDPYVAVYLKAGALGKAYAWNEMKKALASIEIANGTVAAGKGGVATAQALAAKRAEITQKMAFRKAIGFDESISSFSGDMSTVSDAFRRISGLIDKPGEVSLKSVYNASQNPQIKSMIHDFNNGKIQFADGVKASAGLTDSAAADVIQNTYALNKVDVTTQEAPTTKTAKSSPIDSTDKWVDRTVKQGAEVNIADNIPDEMAKDIEKNAQQIGYNAGMTNEGVPYRYTIEDGKITKMEKITDAEGLAESVAGITGTYKVTTTTVEKLGELNVHAVNRAILFFRDEIPVLAEQAVFKVAPDSGSLGWCKKVPDTLHIKDGELVVDEFEVFLSSNYYSKGKEDSTRLYQEQRAGKFHPKNSGDLSSTPIHENGHSTSGKLTLYELNRRIKDGDLKLSELEAMGEANLMWFFIVERDKIQADILQSAMNRIGIKPTPHNINTQRATISGYANYDKELARRNSETIAEAFTDYAFNGVNGSPFSQAIVAEFKDRLGRYTVAANPGEVFAKNGLKKTNGLFNKEGNYAFPTKETFVKTTEVYTPKPLLGQQKPVSFHDTMYHGSGKAKAEIYTSAQVPVLGKGKYWAFSESNAKHFGDKIETKEVSLKNPLMITDDEEWREIAKLAGWEYPNPIGLDEATVTKYTDDLRKMVTESGYDGIIIRMSPTKDTSLLYDVFGVPQVVEYGVDVKTRVVGEEKVDSMSDAQKAKWLDQWRQKNPYLKGDLTEENYRQANLWDTFFQKEINSYDAKASTSAPDLLIKRNGDFLENLSKNSSKMLVDEIKKASIDGFSQELATMVMSRNKGDVYEAMDNFIIKRVEKTAQEIAAKMPGGATEENLNTVRVTLWSENSLKNDVSNMIYTLSPNGDLSEVQRRVNDLFKTQAEGYASIEALPVDVRQLYAEEKALKQKLDQENKYALAVGKEEDSKIKGYTNEVSKVVSYKEGGEDVYLVLSDEVNASLFQRPNNYKETNVFWESVAQMSNWLARTYRLGTTGLNPVALVRNVLRDPLQATFSAGFNPLSMHLSPDVFYRTLRGYGLDDATIETVTSRIKNWAGAGTLTAEIRNFSDNKIDTATYRSRSEKFIKKFNDKTTNNKLVKLGEKPLELWESSFRSQIGAQSFIKNYERTRDVNKALGLALFDTSNATTNFSHAIGHLRRVTGTIPYLSSAINGTASFWRLFNINPIGMITRLTAGFMVPAMAITAWNLSSEEKREQYLSLPEWFRRGHIVILDNENNVYALPIPEEISQFFNVSRKYIEYTQEATPYALPTIAAQGVFGFLPFDVDGFFGDDGSIQIGRGVAQLANGIMPQAATAIYELVAKENLFTGQDISTYNTWNTILNTSSNILGTGWKQVINSIGLMCGVPEKSLVGLSVKNTLARDLFGVGFDDATNQFMELVGRKSSVDPDTGKETKATGLFAENEKLQKQIAALNEDIAYASEEEVPELEKKRQKLIDDFTSKVSNLTTKYMNLYTITGGLEDWKKRKIIQLLTLGTNSGSGDTGSYEMADVRSAGYDERGLALQRYVDAGLPAKSDPMSFSDSIELQAAVNRFYGTTKQATQDYKNAIEESGIKDIRDEFYDAISRIYDYADANNIKPDYDMIERIQARYLQSIDSVLVPIINQYGINILNNNDFIDAVRRQVNGMIPSDDWRQSTKNAKRFLSTKEFPTATVDVKKWLKNRYSSAMRDRGLGSDAEVTKLLEQIKNDIDAGRRGAAKGKIESLRNGINKSNYYISSIDFQTLTEYNNMVK